MPPLLILSSPARSSPCCKAPPASAPGCQSGISSEPLPYPRLCGLIPLPGTSSVFLTAVPPVSCILPFPLSMNKRPATAVCNLKPCNFAGMVIGNGSDRKTLITAVPVALLLYLHFRSRNPDEGGRIQLPSNPPSEDVTFDTKIIRRLPRFIGG